LQIAVSTCAVAADLDVCPSRVPRVTGGRAPRIIPVEATQRPSADIMPTSLRDLFGYRRAFAAPPTPAPTPSSATAPPTPATPPPTSPRTPPASAGCAPKAPACPAASSPPTSPPPTSSCSAQWARHVLVPQHVLETAAETGRRDRQLARQDRPHHMCSQNASVWSALTGRGERPIQHRRLRVRLNDGQQLHEAR
jgi:hypothetical protein